MKQLLLVLAVFSACGAPTDLQDPRDTTSDTYAVTCTRTADCAGDLVCSNTLGVCVTQAVKGSCSRPGTVSVEGACAKPCASASDCAAGSECGYDPNTEARICMRTGTVIIPRYGAACTASSECSLNPNSALNAICDDSKPRGSCTEECGPYNSCVGGECVRPPGKPYSECRASCPRPDGTRGTCRKGYVCKPVADSTSGACAPDGE